jgi:hypothetical protein
MIGAAELFKADEWFGDQATKSGLSAKDVGAIFERLAVGKVALILLATHALFIVNLDGVCSLCKVVGQAAARGEFTSKLALDLSGCVTLAGGDPRGLGFEKNAAGAGGFFEKQGVKCEQWCALLAGSRNVEHTFSCSNMRHLFLEVCGCEPLLPLADILDIFVRMRTALNGAANLCVTPGDINQTLVPVQLWMMGAPATRWDRPFERSWGSVHMGVLAPLKMWAIPYVLAGLERMTSALHFEADNAGSASVRKALKRAANIVATRARQVHDREIE